MPNGEGIVRFIFDETRLAIGEFGGHFPCEFAGEIAVLDAVPEAHVNADFVEWETPRLGEDGAIAVEPIRSTPPGLAVIMETSVKNFLIGEGFRLGGWKFS